MDALSHRVVDGALRMMAASGAARALAPVSRGRGAILMFHHVRPAPAGPFAPNAGLAVTPDFLDRALGLLRSEGFDLVPLDDVPGLLRDEGSSPFAALTFDDGLRDNLEHALPVLRRHGAPWTLFATTGFADGTARLWWLELEEALGRLDRVRLSLDGDVLDLPSANPAAKQATFDALYSRLRAGPEERLRAAVAALAAEAGVDSRRLTREQCLTWDELRALAAEPGVTIGAHTLTHPMLAKHPEAVARREIATSKSLIEGRLGLPVRHFAYPVGDPTSAGPREFRLAAEAGFATAVTTRPGHCFADHAAHLHALPRVSVNGRHQSASALRALLSGAPYLAWNRGRRVNAG